MPATESVAVFWDYENCAVPTNVSGSIVANNIRKIAHRYGSVKTFKAYMELPEQSSPKSYALRSELQLCGVSLIDCPHNGSKDVADKMMIVDMMAYAIDTQAPATIILISGDRDFVYAVSVLCLRQYRLIVLAPHAAHASLKAQASVVFHWPADVMPDEQSSDGVKSRSGIMPDRSRSVPLPLATERPTDPAPASPPLSPAAPKRPVSTSAPSDSALLRPSYKWADLLSSATPSSDTTAVDPAAEGPAFLAPGNETGDSYFSKPYQQPSPSPSPKRDAPDIPRMAGWAFASAEADTLQLNPDASMFASALGSAADVYTVFPPSTPPPPVGSAKRAFVPHFRPLVKVLRQRLKEGVQQLAYSELGTLLRQECPNVYEQAGVSKLKEYCNLAEEAQVVILTENAYGPGGVDGQRWVSLHPRLVKGAAQKAALKALDDWTLMTRQGTSK
ncbi:DUF537-domain-containing protein [Daedalea quercina L-15889]|uniref:DUF537-domain-containing protein n=1 Tax=Daedalea quercina L-15889 TaxID=1314783 RepID=A0A165MBJ3_9APHY|nr:DUF537-domain-containing protein [Daedalea quercina L-15889]